MNEKKKIFDFFEINIDFSEKQAYTMGVAQATIQFILPIASSPPTIRGVTKLWAFFYRERVFMDVSKATRFDVKTAILVDGGFYRKRAKTLAGSKSPKDRADELERLCHNLLRNNLEHRHLYRVFYYDCPPIPNGENVYHPLRRKSVNLGDSENGQWMRDFLGELKHRRKFALRMGRLSKNSTGYNLKPEVTKALLNGTKQLGDLKEEDFKLNLMQKGIDVRIAVDISSMAFKKQVDQIILIAGDGDFVPAAKQARREGIDFILDPMENHIPDDLYEHIDGIRQPSLTFEHKPAIRESASEELGTVQSET